MTGILAIAAAFIVMAIGGAGIGAAILFWTAALVGGGVAAACILVVILIVSLVRRLIPA